MWASKDFKLVEHPVTEAQLFDLSIAEEANARLEKEKPVRALSDGAEDDRRIVALGRDRPGAGDQNAADLQPRGRGERAGAARSGQSAPQCRR